MKFQKTVALSLAIAAAAAGMAGCGGKNGEVEGKVNVTVGGWPTETNPKSQETYNGWVEELKTTNPDINIIPDTGSYADNRSFQVKAAANQLPTVWDTHLTEVKQTIKSGYAADITEILKEKGLMDALNPAILALGEKDGKYYALPKNAYLMGLTVNKNLFEEAGLVNADGTVMVPDTYEQMAEYAKIIKEKTGKAGFAICTTNNCGGWHFMNIAWSYGVKFMEQREDGTWEATFNTQEAVDALQFVKDLQWKYGVLPEDKVIDQPTIHKLLGVGQAAMIFEAPTSDYSQKYGLDPKKVAMVKMPKGPAGRYVQTGGSVYMFSPTATKEQLEGAFTWIETTGFKKVLDDEAIAAQEKSMQNTIDENGIVFPGVAIPLWVNEERVQKDAELRAKYSQVDKKDFESYYDISDVTLHEEEPMACQQLYAVLDGCIQEVITNENADCKALIENACKDFQTNHLDKLD